MESVCLEQCVDKAHCTCIACLLSCLCCIYVCICICTSVYIHVYICMCLCLVCSEEARVAISDDFLHDCTFVFFTLTRVPFVFPFSLVACVRHAPQGDRPRVFCVLFAFYALLAFVWARSWCSLGLYVNVLVRTKVLCDVLGNISKHCILFMKLLLHSAPGAPRGVR